MKTGMIAACVCVASAALLLSAEEPKKEKPAAPAKPAAATPEKSTPARPAGEPPAMFGGTLSRNMVSDEKNLPEIWDVAKGANVKWVATLGSQSYAGPVIHGGKVYVGTNNEALKNPKLKGDRGNVMAFNLADGSLVWQSAHAKLPSGMVNDWPLQGVCSTPFIDGERIYYVSNRAELICADTEGFRDGENDGPFTTETEKSEIDEDVIWKYDMIADLNVFPHNLAAGSPIGVGDLIFTVSGNGVDEGHVNVPSPDAPTFIAVNRNTGKLVWEDSSPGEKTLHGSWSNPAYGVVKGRAQVVIPGGDGWVYSFEPQTGKVLWKFDANPKDAVYILGGSGTKSYIIATPVIWEDKVYIAVGQDPEHGEGIGHLWAIDATQDGDVTDKAAVWHRGGKDFHRTISTVAIHDGLVYASDLSGFLYCLDARTGTHHWTHDMEAAVWGSPFVADGKVYLGDEDGDVTILKEGKTKQVIATMNMGNTVYTTPVAKDGVLYIVSRTKLFALAKGAQWTPPAAPAAASGAAKQ